MLRRIHQVLQKDLLIYILILLFVLLVGISRFSFATYISFINFEMLGILLIMMIITAALQLSGIFTYIANRLIAGYKKKRQIALALTIFTALLATFLTNDITLFIVLPIVLNLRKHFSRKFWYLVVYILFAANIGSGLTPIGNPQNIIIWRKWDIDFQVFVVKMLPFFVISSIVLIAFILMTFKADQIDSFEQINFSKDKKLFWISATWLVVFIIAVEFNVEELFFVLIPVFYLKFYRKIFKEIDWGILIIFLFIFLDFNIFSHLPIFNRLHSMDFVNRAEVMYWLSLGISQVVSNVPATVMLTNFTDKWLALALGVNIGSQGTVIGSLANIIGVRLNKDSKLILRYHILGVPFLIITAVVIFFVYF